MPTVYNEKAKKMTQYMKIMRSCCAIIIQISYVEQITARCFVLSYCASTKNDDKDVNLCNTKMYDMTRDIIRL